MTDEEIDALHRHNAVMQLARAPSNPGYSAAAVQNAINSHNRRPRGGRISKREATLIHRLLSTR